MSDDISYDRFVRTPFVVESTVITKENIQEIADLVGEVKEKAGELYIALDRRVVPNLSKAFIGWHFTRMDDNYRCYSPKVFEQQFIAVPEDGMISFDVSPEPAEALELDVV
jgi:hypothetical protein